MVTSNIELFNALRQTKNSAFYGRIPKVTQDNLSSVGTRILAYKPMYDELTGTIVQKIGEQILSKKGTLVDTLECFNRGTLAYGSTIEEVYAPLIAVEQFNEKTSEKDLFKVVKNDLKTYYHSINRELVYTLTISELKLKRAVFSEYGLANLIEAGLKDSVIRSQILDNYELKKQYFLQAIKDGIKGTFVKVIEVPKGSNAEEMTIALRAEVDLLRFSNKSTISGLENSVDPEDVVIITDPYTRAKIDVTTLAKSFHLDKAETEKAITIIDNFGDVEKDIELKDVVAVAGSKYMVNSWDTEQGMRQVENGKGLTINHFKHNQGIDSYSMVAPFIIIKEAAQ